MKTKENFMAVGQIIGLVGGFGASMLVGAAVSPILASARVANKIVMTLGAAGLSGIASDKVYAWFSEGFVNIGELTEDLMDSIKKHNESKEQEVEA